MPNQFIDQNKYKYFRLPAGLNYDQAEMLFYDRERNAFLVEEINIEDLLTLGRQQVLEELEKELPKEGDTKVKEYQEYKDGFNDCLSQVKEIIKKIN